jgi:hypothetical protein
VLRGLNRALCQPITLWMASAGPAMVYQRSSSAQTFNPLHRADMRIHSLLLPSCSLLPDTPIPASGIRMYTPSPCHHYKRVRLSGTAACAAAGSMPCMLKALQQGNITPHIRSGPCATGAPARPARQASVRICRWPAEASQGLARANSRTFFTVLRMVGTLAAAAAAGHATSLCFGEHSRACTGPARRARAEALQCRMAPR